MTNQAARDWRVVLLAICAGSGGLLAIAMALSGVAYAAFAALPGQQGAEALDPLGAFVLSGSLALVGALLVATSFQAFQAWRGRPEVLLTARPMRIWEGALLLLVWIGSSVIAQILTGLDPWKWATPFLHLSAIGTPVYFLIRLVLGGVYAGSRLRLWGTMAAGLVLGTGLAAAVEFLLLLLGLSAGAVYLVFNPQHLLSLETMASQLAHTASMEDALALLEPWLAQPLVLIVVLLAVSGVSPVVEELAKSAAPWAIFGRLSTPAHGFCCGAVSGAGFALFEGLIASTDPTGNWAFVFVIRGWSSMMHILASALVGWGIAAYRQSGRAAPMIGGYALAVSIHALWNASVVAIGFGGLRSMLGGPGIDLVGMAILGAGTALLMTQLALLPTALILINRHLRPKPSDFLLQPGANDSEVAPLAGLEG